MNPLRGPARVAAIERAAACLLPANLDDEIRAIGHELNGHLAAGRRRANAERDGLLVEGLACFYST